MGGAYGVSPMSIQKKTSRGGGAPPRSPNKFVDAPLCAQLFQVKAYICTEGHINSPNFAVSTNFTENTKRSNWISFKACNHYT